jgi:hypothetical protein
MRLHPLYGSQPAYRRGQFLCSAAEPVSSPRPALLRRRRAVDVKAGRRSDLAKYTDIARPCLDIHEHGGRLDAVGRQRAISGIGLAINSVRRPKDLRCSD